MAIRKIVVCITGASGVIYGLRVIEILTTQENIETHLVVSKNAKTLLKEELGVNEKILYEKVNRFYSDDDLTAPISSGSFKTESMVIVPCSMSTLSKIANGISDTLITRTALVALKERRKLVLVPRETPLATVHLENMYKLSLQGVVILPASPGFYGKQKTFDELVNFVAGKVLDALNVEHDIYPRFKV